jgi:multidrug efflux pump
MRIADVSIRRPVLATVMNLLILVVGLVAWRSLPVREYPDVDAPVVSVSTAYFGASPQTIETSITVPLEEVLNGVEGLRSISSMSAFGVSQIAVELVAGRDIDLAATDVSNAVQQALGNLPLDAEKPVIVKSRAESQPIMWISLLGDAYSAVDRTDIADRLIKTPLQLLPGVSRVIIGGERRYAMRVWLDPARMAARGVEATDVRAAIRNSNLQTPAGEIEGTGRKFTVNIDAKIDDPRVYDRLVIRRDGDSVVRIEDVGRVELGSGNYDTITRSDAVSTVGVGVIRQSTANELEVSRAVRAALPGIQATLPPGLELVTAVDNTVFVEASLREAFNTLLIALALVVVINLLFLRSVITTLITAVAIPVSMVGTLAVMYAVGFSINVLTVLALILAIGLLVDDSIVVLENIYRRQELGESRRRAALNGTREVAFAVIATTAAVVAVLVPLSAMPGNTGKLFREFSFTMATAVVLSGFVALTLVPMACSIFLRLGKQHGRAYYAIERGLEGLATGYRHALRWSVAHRAIVGLFFFGTLVATFLLLRTIPTTLVPVEDRGQILTVIRAPQGSTAAYTDRALHKVEGFILEVPEVARTFAAIGLGFGGPPDTSNGIVFTRLRHWDDRDRTQQSIVAELFPKFLAIPEALVFPINPPSLGQGSRSADIEVVLKSTDAELRELEQVAGALVAEASQIPGLINVDSDVRLDNPQLDLEIDRETAADLGVSVASIAESVRLLVAEGPADEFVLRNKEYDIVMALAPRYRSMPEQLGEIHVRAADGRMVPLDSLVRVLPTSGPATLNHYAQQRSATVTANLGPGATLGQTLPAVLETAERLMPPGWSTDLRGVSREFSESSTAIYFTLAVVLVVIFLVLSAQFESFLHPFTVMMSVPLATLGALATLQLTSGTLNIYSGIGIILLVGLVTKNAILLVDFANQERARGTALVPAMIAAGAIRFRPILMTSVTSILGAMPLAFAVGAGAESRRQIGLAIVGGLTFSTVFTLLVVPVVYLAVVKVAERMGLNTIPPAVELEIEVVREEDEAAAVAAAGS